MFRFVTCAVVLVGLAVFAQSSRISEQMQNLALQDSNAHSWREPDEDAEDTTEESPPVATESPVLEEDSAVDKEETSSVGTQTEVETTEVGTQTDDVEDDEAETSEPGTTKVSSRIKVDVDDFKKMKKSARWILLEKLDQEQVQPYKALVDKKAADLKALDDALVEEENNIKALQAELNTKREAYEKKMRSLKRDRGRAKRMRKKIEELTKIAEFF